MTLLIHCRSCGAAWSAGAFSARCDECGGGAMERGCPMCGGRCGQRWRRAVQDSGDAGLAHWIGHCDARMGPERSDEDAPCEWWLDHAALPDHHWARLTAAPGGWIVRDMDQREHCFASRDAAVDWLRDEEYEPLDRLKEDGAVAAFTVPPDDL